MKSAVAPCPPSLFPPLDMLHVLHHQRGAHAGQRAEENAAEVITFATLLAFCPIAT